MNIRAGALLAVLGLMPASALAAPILIVSNDGILQGAKGVVVGGVTYDVSFGDGSCAELFTGCDAVSDFTFQTQVDAIAAAQALLEQVFVPNGQFANSPDMISGCVETPFEFCLVFIPYALEDDGRVINASTSIYSTVAPVVEDAVTGSPDVDLPLATYAIFTETVVPEPAALPLLLLGGVGLRYFHRRRRRSGDRPSLA